MSEFTENPRPTHGEPLGKTTVAAPDCFLAGHKQGSPIWDQGSLLNLSQQASGPLPETLAGGAEAPFPSCPCVFPLPINDGPSKRKANISQYHACTVHA